MPTSGWDVSQESEPEDSLNSGKFSQVGEEGGEVQFGGSGDYSERAKSSPCGSGEIRGGRMM